MYLKSVMSADQTTKLAHQLILLTNAFVHLVVWQKLTLGTERTLSEAVRRWLTEQSFSIDLLLEDDQS